MTVGKNLDAVNKSSRSIYQVLTRLVLTILVPLLGFSAVVLWQITEQQRQSVEEQARNAAADLAHDIDREIYAVIATLSGLATSPALQSGDVGVFEGQVRRVAALIDTPILLRDAATGAQLINTRLDSGAPLPQLPQSLMDRTVIDTRAPYISDVRIGQVTGKPLIAIAVPVMKGQGVTAILVAAFDPVHVAGLIRSQSLSANWATEILDRQGVVIGGSRPSSVIGTKSPLTLDGIANGNVERLNDPHGHAFVRAIKKTAHGWTTVASTPVALLEGPIANSWLAFLVAGAGLLAFALPATVLLSRRIAAAITRTATTAAALERGEVVPMHGTGLREVDDVLASLHVTSLKLRQRTRALAETAARVKSTFEQAAVGFVQTDLDGHWVSVNRRFSDMLGYGEVECLALSPASVTHPEDRLIEAHKLDAILKGQVASATYEQRYINKDQSIIWVRVTTSLVHSSDGHPMYYLSLVEDVTATHQASTARIKLAALVEAASDAMISVSAGNIIEASNPSATRLFGIDQAGLIGTPLSALFSPARKPEVDRLLDQAWQGHRGRIETALTHTSGRSVAALFSAAPIRWTGEAITGLAVTIEDIQERKDWEMQLLMLNRELQHRVKNSLAVVQSIANQTIRASKTLDVFRTAFEGRLQALAGAHDLLLQSAWTGDDLRTIIEKQVFPLVADPERQIKVTGETVTLSADLTVPLSLALHELGTNALKHGALSTSTGRVEIDCKVENVKGEDIKGERELVLTWSECGGPPALPPTRSGFGSTLIQRGIRGARVDNRYEPTGLICILRVILPPAPDQSSPQYSPSLRLIGERAHGAPHPLA